MIMNPEYRRELRHLARIENKLVFNLLRGTADVVRQHQRLDRRLERSRQGTFLELARLHQRRAILKGRLS
jgi:hypothetical protein